ncbi:pseudouridylate synthase TRUB2, mitochondrial-like [Littorina saxatilis]|uniref:Pseudouridine synthase II N-terminal domain-containing protein n=1 Tax=Littorina saxatilis TaxID=31220 RepID=A0AAN9AXS6_9CAEN
MPRFEWAPAAFRRLNGLLCVYKPADVSVVPVLRKIQFNLAKELNALPCYKVESEMRKANPNTDFTAPMVLDTSVPVPAEDLMEHRLVLGQRYLPEDIKLSHIHSLSRFSSGVLLIGVGRGIRKVDLLSSSKFLRVYHVKGRFGMATSDFTPSGKIIERTSYRHIHPIKLDKVLASVQSSHLRNMFHYAGVDPHSQAAYELAAQGLVRPQDSHTPPMIYRVKCIDFQPPDFTLEIHAINEFCDYFMRMIHDIGLQLRSTAVCTGIRRLRYGHFDVSHALLRQQWNFEDILDNMKQNAAMLTPDKLAGEGIMEKIESQESTDDRKRIEDEIL